MKKDMEIDRLRSNTILEGSSFINRNENKNEFQNQIEKESRERGSLNRNDIQDNSSSNNVDFMKVYNSYNSYSRIHSPQTSNIFNDEKVSEK